jgi:hypothetical protein
MSPESAAMSTATYPEFQLVDLEPKIAAINPAYLSDATVGQRGNARIHTLHHAGADGRLYLVYADSFVFWSADDCQTLQELREVNYQRGRLAAGAQSIDAIVDTLPGTVVLVGRDRHEGTEQGVVWRKERGRARFVRSVATAAPWPTNKSGNVVAGFFGSEHREMIALAPYAAGAHVYFSLDDGLSWRRQDLAGVFAEHVHQVYLPPAATIGRKARLWITGGDDASGARSGLVCFDSLDAGGSLAGLQYVLHERPGYRLVGLAGDGKHVFVGNESVSGGVLKLLDDQQSIELGDFEYALGKNRHDYHQFRSLIATFDGILASATDSYGWVSDTIRADSGGYFYLSTDGGASFREVSVGAKWTSAMTYDGRAFWAALSMSRDDGPDSSSRRLMLARLSKPANFAPLSEPYCVKAVLVDSSGLYEFAGCPEHPRASLQPGERTFRVDMSCYGTISLEVETWNDAVLVVEALAFRNWRPEEDAWVVVKDLVLKGGERRTALLSRAAAQHRYFRVRNGGESAAEVRLIAFVGRT